MPKETTVALRMTQEEMEQLEKLASGMYRTKSDMIRFLIHQEWTKLHTQQAAQAECQTSQIAG